MYIIVNVKYKIIKLKFVKKNTLTLFPQGQSSHWLDIKFGWLYSRPPALCNENKKHIYKTYVNLSQMIYFFK